MLEGVQCPKRNAPGSHTQAIFPPVLDGHEQEMTGRLEVMRASSRALNS